MAEQTQAAATAASDSKKKDKVKAIALTTITNADDGTKSVAAGHVFETTPKELERLSKLSPAAGVEYSKENWRRFGAEDADDGGGE